MRPLQLRPSSSSCARALLMKLLGRAGALSQRARCGALRFPFLPLVRRPGAKVCQHRTSLLATPAPAITTHTAPAPLYQAYRPSSPLPRRHTISLPPSSSPVRVRRSPPLASLLPHLHLAPRPLPALRSPSSRSFSRLFFHPRPPLRRDMATVLSTFSASLLVDIH